MKSDASLFGYEQLNQTNGTYKFKEHYISIFFFIKTYQFVTDVCICWPVVIATSL